ncbi:uncharacterized protein CYBJADRAFT_167475 [Cyberlindnera jadinii NRRL Y-1542]|uniref:Uncharacterized protein n=1 Tax=Cyberlindnera jadinii (strain ATCC 18201 / CBS 1600 / BCRC 20928 / JCM 3617 / NBRC 0987 / NRRL Y-1542) TaxID=983966 RepID=A0A1E4S3Q8_CYBJN|nr:hypothetical protein CYBJADRAFT_170091 [Cyberlindnera jadinii NRRL Y-1542]XP_020071132.1 hypothetical protein CYBJADRAFT_167475 [Cyberlindnera jadinii NRRL Y-1542]ODV70634.1 hypothetical protein CYBJADRAFT_170091 [Cyberlindnera jadinii NRRL Y-1542]ODV74093.1 hypothetical protein CYBJADRAFT_167475 [Cyberlindnera jadinii NRRL Y-1542]
MNRMQHCDVFIRHMSVVYTSEKRFDSIPRPITTFKPTHNLAVIHAALITQPWWSSTSDLKG